ncbi:MAG: hypothetical protein ABJB98_01355 [Actinomycetota bacterium]
MSIARYASPRLASIAAGISSMVRVVDARTIGLGINAGRAVLGATVLVLPVGALRQLAVDPSTLPRVSWLIRTAGIRDAALGTGAVVSLVGGGGASWVLAGAACDAVDAVVTAQAVRDQSVDALRGRVVAGVAVASAALGVVSAIALRRRC